MRLADRIRHLSLRSRVTLLFLMTGLVAAVLLSGASYVTARTYLLQRRDEIVERQSFNNAQLIRTQLRTRRSEAFELISGIRTESNGFAILHLSPEDLYFSQDIRNTQTLLPTELVAATLQGITSRQRFSIDGEPFIAVGVSINEINAQYFEVFPLTDEERTLTIIGSTLLVGVLVVGSLSSLVGLWVSRRLMRPLERVSEAASEIAGGGLDTRLEQENDPDLSRLVSSFNEMADAVQTRIEREVRFASDLSDRTQQALDVVVSQIRRFDQMVLDLLELSRLDAGITEVIREEIDIVVFIRRIASRYGVDNIQITVSEGSDSIIKIDKRRFERIMANLLENARLHGGGVSLVEIERQPDGSTRISVEDSGPGVAQSERVRIFERFARGSAGRSRAGGTGLGLALVAEHARAHGGSAWVEDAGSGGARFVVEFPGDKS